MLLTDEQRQFVEAAGDKPVELVDPLTQRTYFLLSAELYQCFRGVVEALQNDKPATDAAEDTSEVPPMRVKLRDLPMPPEVAAEVKKCCKELGLWRRKYVREVEDDLKMQHYYGGKYVAYLWSEEEGPVVVAVGRLQSAAFERQLAYLTPAERRETHQRLVDIWDDPNTLILSLGHP